MSNLKKRPIHIACGFMMLLFTGMLAAANEPIRVGVYDFEPLCSINASGEADGFFVDLFEYIAEKEGWHYTYVEGALPTLLEQLETGQLDLVLMYYDKNQSNRFDFMEETLISTWAQAYAANKSDIQSLLDLADKRVGVVRDDPYNLELRGIVRRLNIDCRFVEFKQYEDVFKSLEKGWIDAGVIDRLYAVPHELDYHSERIPIIFSPVELRVSAGHGANRKLLAALDYHFNALKKDQYSVYYQHINKIWNDNEPAVLSKYIVYGLILTAGLLIITGSISLLLRRQIKVKTAEIRRKNKALEKEVTMRREAETALLSSHVLLSKTISSMHDSLLVVDSGWTEILDCNVAASHTFKYTLDDLMMISPEVLFDKTDFLSCVHSDLPKKIEEQGFFSDTIELRCQDDERFPAEFVLTPIEGDKQTDCWVLIIRNIADRIALRKSETRLQQAQKMEAIGTLAGGIAHDFNNILVPIIGYSELLLHTIDSSEAGTRDFLTQIMQAGHRAKSLVAQILAFSRKEEQEKELISISHSIQESIRFIRASLPSTIDIRLCLDSPEDTIFADPTQVHQVIMNLCSNAAQAMKTSGGLLEIGIARHQGDLLGWTTDTALSITSCLRFWVKDTGHGIPEPVLHRIFDPFFTTKKQGEGTGMGLSVVHGIVKSYEGAISVESQPGAGTTFHVYLPLAEEKIEKKDKQAQNVYQGQSECVLIVDDEPMIVDMIERMLTANGYRVDGYTNSTEALQTFRGNPDAFDLVITDQTMPGLTGLEMAKAMLSIRAELPVILCTGFSETISPEMVEAAGIREFVYKPFSTYEISEMIHRVIHESREDRVEALP